MSVLWAIAAAHGHNQADDIATQFMLMEGHARDPQTGLLYHAWDQTRQQRWANPRTGQSPNFWGRAVGWYAMALVDTLDYFPKDHPKREMLIAIMKRLAIAIGKYQDSKSGLWYEVIAKGGAPGNYLEASASCMFVYALVKGVREAYLPNSYLKIAQKAYQGITDQFIEAEANGQVNLKGTVSVGGLGGTPYRDGSYEYYLSEKVLTNDPKGIGAFLLAELLSHPTGLYKEKRQRLERWAGILLLTLAATLVSPFGVHGDLRQQSHGVLVERFAGRHRRVVVHGGQRALGGLLIDVVEDQRLAGVVVVNGGLVQPDHVGDVVHPGAVVAACGEQLGGNNQQLLAAGEPVLG